MRASSATPAWSCDHPGQIWQHRGMASTMRFARVGVTMLSVHDHRDPSESDWNAYVAAYAEGAREHGVRGLLAVSRGGGPNARQHKHLAPSDPKGERDSDSVE